MICYVLCLIFVLPQLSSTTACHGLHHISDAQKSGTPSLSREMQTSKALAYVSGEHLLLN